MFWNRWLSMQNRKQTLKKRLIKKHTITKLNGLKMTYIGQASLWGAGTGGTAHVKTMIDSSF